LHYGRIELLTQKSGQLGEDKALDYLQQQGLKCVARNYLCRLGEIDLIMRDGSYLVFVEVRVRSGSGYGGGVASITPAKKQKIIKAATHYLMKQALYDKCPLRFDVLSIDGNSSVISWVKDAFGIDY